MATSNQTPSTNLPRFCFLQTYAIGITAAFAVLTGTLEGALVARALGMASAASMTPADVVHAIRANPDDEAAAVEGGERRPNQGHPSLPSLSASPPSPETDLALLAKSIASKPRAGGRVCSGIRSRSSSRWQRQQGGHSCSALHQIMAHHLDGFSFRCPLPNQWGRL